MSRALNGPIAGQSLTDEPSNYPWERPPETADPTEALSMHLKKMAGPKFMDSALYMMELGVRLPGGDVAANINIMIMNPILILKEIIQKLEPFPLKQINNYLMKK